MMEIHHVNEAVEQFYLSLCELKDIKKDCNRPMIEMLTILAEENKEVDEEIVKVIIDLIYEVKADHKLPYLYLIDSICKKSDCFNYVALFTKYLVNLIGHVYTTGNDYLKYNVIKLRKIWENMFSRSLLNELDDEMNTICLDWPFSRVRTRSSTSERESIDLLNKNTQGELQCNQPLFKTNQHVLTDPKNSTRPQMDQQPSNDYVNHANQPNQYFDQSTMNLQSNQSAMNRQSNQPMISQQHSQPSAPNNQPVFNLPVTNLVQPNVVPHQPTPADPMLAVDSSFINNNAFLNRNSQSNTGSNPNQTSYMNRHPSKRCFVKSYSLCRYNPFHNNSNNRRRAFDSDSISFKRSRIGRLNNSSNQPRMFNRFGQTNGIQNNKMQPDIQHNFQTSIHLNQTPLQQLSTNVPFLPDSQMPANTVLLNNKPTSPFTESYITFENRKYKIYHLDEKASIILMNCPITSTFNEIQNSNPHLLDPRLVYFEGQPVNVYIDERDAILLSFNNQWKKFYSNGFEQYIKFGSPDREIYLNNQIIRAKFGGLAVHCKLNGDIDDHTIRLDLPAPSLKLSTYSRVDLWHNLIKKFNQFNQLNQLTSPPVSSVQPATQRQQKSTVIEPARIVKRSSPVHGRSSNHRTKSSMREHQKEKSSRSAKRLSLRRASASDSECELDLEPESLKHRRPELIDKLYEGLQCTSCSLRFNIDTSEAKLKYSKHLDWHFRKNRKNRNKTVATSREWYYPLDQWLEFKEINLDFDDRPDILEQTVRSNSNSKLKFKLSGFKLNGGNLDHSKKEVIKANSDDSLNKCSTCFERFQQQWCDDADEWQLVNATIVDGNYYHPTCLIDKSNESIKQIDLNNTELTDHDLIDSLDDELIDS